MPTINKMVITGRRMNNAEKLTAVLPCSAVAFPLLPAVALSSSLVGASLRRCSLPASSVFRSSTSVDSSLALCSTLDWASSTSARSFRRERSVAADSIRRRTHQRSSHRPT
jgi:hypothetical protein